MTVSVLYNAMSARVGGGLTYARNQVAALGERDDLRLVVLSSPWNHERLRAVVEGSAVHVERVDVPNAAARFVWEQVRLPARARSYDVLVSPANFGPLWSPVPHIVIQQNPNYVGTGRRLPQNRSIRRRLKIAQSRWSMRRADVVVSISRSMEREMATERGLGDVRNVVIRSGAPAVDAHPQPVPDDVLARIGSSNFLLSVANDYPHKRLGEIGALAATLADDDRGPDRFVFVGDLGANRRAEVLERAGRARDRIVFLGVVADAATVRGLYQRAAVAVSTSELESWGLTLHEAGAQGCPVVATGLDVHRELAGDRVRYFSVGDVDAFAAEVVAALEAPRPAPWSMERPWSENAAELVALVGELTRSVSAGDQS